ncbi:MAG: cupin domain-containing protein [Leptolyngbyaceae cyanobacterium SM1_1_3]|nr:cupin domain-containing protein [Leptolyngbyaceae cyanobacterium SM1_1_3]NJN03469.1 cupin domain-containing protein [Leptolyngbyaceae cyanobacterium RM1_1_2]NJO09506.1 cupin domain-containing protein [Leptolyngbyaceae cyanobacterium SL_1_1]
MAILTILDENRTLTEPLDIKNYLAAINIGYARWQPDQPLSETATTEEILAAYSDEIEILKESGGYITADVIDIKPNTPNLDAMLSKFTPEHWHDEDEVRFTLEGRGLFHINPENGPVIQIEVTPGDLLLVPRGTHHWFNLCSDRQIRAIRLFQDPSGWNPHYTNSQKEQQYPPLCVTL